MTLARYHGLISLAVEGKLDGFLLDEGLQDRLIHFTHARKPVKGENILAGHKAKTVSEYLAKFREQSPDIAGCYARFCDLVHPGATSILAFVTCNDDGTLVQLSPSNESMVIENLVADISTHMPIMTALGITTSLLILKVLNTFPIRHLHTTFMETVRLDGMPAWEQVKAYLSESQSPDRKLGRRISS